MILDAPRLLSNEPFSIQAIPRSSFRPSFHSKAGGSPVTTPGECPGMRAGGAFSGFGGTLGGIAGAGAWMWLALEARWGQYISVVSRCVRRGYVCNLYFVGICRRVRMKYKLQLYPLNFRFYDSLPSPDSDVRYVQ